MKKLFLAAILLGCAVRSGATTYYISPAGNDANNGLSAGAAWLTPNHAVNCGDVLQAAAGAYVFSNFAHTWGTVTCPASNDVAWVKCTVFDTCKISVSTGSTGDAGMFIQASYWGVQGWEITTTVNSGGCFITYPWNLTAIHHVIFANDICNGAGNGGFTIDPRPPYVTDYIAFIGDIAYNTVQGGSFCGSGFNMGSQNPLDTVPGTHIYFGGNFAFNNTNGNPCNGAAPTDGQGFMVDTLMGNTAQILFDNNISAFNGGRGVEVYNSASAPIYFRSNTVYGNNKDQNQQNHGPCGEIEVTTASLVDVTLNLAQQVSPIGCAVQTNYVYFTTSTDATTHIHNNWGHSAAGNNSSTGATVSPFGPDNTLGMSPNFANPVDPSAPFCGSFASVPACMAQVIANFTPTNAAAKSYGYQIPKATPVYDLLFPQWLCTVTNLPTGLVTMGCLK